jgi:GNAT superfamily N-acetyltransferase
MPVDAFVPGGVSWEVTVREFRPGDGSAVRALVLAGLAEHWGSVDPSLNGDLDDLELAYPGSSTVVAVTDDETIVGTGTVVPLGEAAEVVRMSVAMHVRGRGLGRQVLDALVEIARGWGARRLVLETTATWDATVAFYERCGFRITHYTDGDFGRDAWFERGLDEPSP